MDIKQIQEGSSVFFLTAARPRSRARKTIGMKWSGASCHFNFNLFFTRLLQIMEKKDPWKTSRSLSKFVEETPSVCHQLWKIFGWVHFWRILWDWFFGFVCQIIEAWRLKSGHIIFESKSLWICIWWHILILFNLIVKNRIRS